jgi:hypothetical protein
MTMEQDTIWTPLEIELLLKAYYYEIKPKDMTSKEHLNGVDGLKNNGLIDCCVVNKDCYTITGRGRAFVRMLLNTPMPVLKWIDPRNL